MHDVSPEGFVSVMEPVVKPDMTRLDPEKRAWIKQHGEEFMQTRHQVMLLAAGLLVGAQIGIASIGTPIADTSDQMEPASGAEIALEAGTPGEPTEAQSEIAATPDVSAQTSIVADEQPIAVTARYTGPQGTAFPASADDVQMLPALAAYLDRTAHLRLTGASGNVFPPSTDDQPMLPAVVAYFNRLEATRLAAAQQQQLARSESSASPAINLAANQPAVTAPAGQTSSSAQDLEALNSRPPTSAGAPF